MKKLLSFSLALLMAMTVLCAIPFSASAAGGIAKVELDYRSARFDAGDNIGFDVLHPTLLGYDYGFYSYNWEDGDGQSFGNFDNVVARNDQTYTWRVKLEANDGCFFDADQTWVVFNGVTLNNVSALATLGENQFQVYNSGKYLMLQVTFRYINVTSNDPSLDTYGSGFYIKGETVTVDYGQLYANQHVVWWPYDSETGQPLYSQGDPYLLSAYLNLIVKDYPATIEARVESCVYDGGQVTKKATCAVDGVKTFTCTVCGRTKTESIPATGKHSFKIKDEEQDVFAATLTEDGYKLYTCETCGKTKKTVIPMVSDITVSKTTFTANGKVQKPTVTVKDSTGTVLKAGEDYRISYSNTSSKAAGTYTITISAGDREDERSGWEYFFTDKITYKIKPSKPTGLKAAGFGVTSLKFTWKAAKGAKYYQVYQSTDGKSWKKAATVSTNSATIKNLKAGTKYQFKVRALDAKKKVAGAFSDVVKTQTKTSAPKISKLTSTKSNKATVTWKKVTGAKSYTVYTSTDNKTFKAVKTGITSTSFTVTKLAGGKKIYVKVAAVNAYGKASALSEVKSVTVKK